MIIKKTGRKKKKKIRKKEKYKDIKNIKKF